VKADKTGDLPAVRRRKKAVYISGLRRINLSEKIE
jgi:hypothetical protein